MFYILIFIILIIILNFIIFNKNKVINDQILKQKQFGNARFNKILYNYKKTHEFKGKIYSTYQPLEVLPEFTNLSKYHWTSKKISTNDFNKILSDPDILYLLVQDMYLINKTKKEIEEKIRIKKLILLLNFNDFYLYEIKK